MKKVYINFVFIILIIFYLFIGNYFNIYIPCPIHKLIKLYCPGCGITRMLNSLIHLNFYEAFRYNILVFCLIPILIIYFILEIRSHFINKKNIMNTSKFKNFWIFLIIITIIFGIMRNIPAFSFLAPPTK